MRKKSALILIQWSLGQVKHCVHVTFIQRPIAMRIDGKPLDLRCKWFLFLWECRKSPISDSALLYHRCQLILDSMALLVAWSRGSEVEKPNSRLEVRCLVSYRERFDVFSSPSRITGETYPYLQFYSVNHFDLSEAVVKARKLFWLVFVVVVVLTSFVQRLLSYFFSKARKYHCIPKLGDRKIRHNIWAP